MRRFYLMFAVSVGSSLGWWAGESFSIWAALLGSAVGSIFCVWLVWRYREFFGG